MLMHAEVQETLFSTIIKNFTIFLKEMGNYGRISDKTVIV